MLAVIKDCEISEKESDSDHTMLKIDINLANDKTKTNNFPGLRYVIKEQQRIILQKKTNST